MARPSAGRSQLAVPWWLPVASLLLALAGVGVASYLTIAHYNEHVQLFCSDKGAINCSAVTTSSDSRLFGVPVALLGLLYFGFIAVLLTPAAWRCPWPLLRRARLATAGVGLLFVLWLIYAELFRVGKLCLYCTAVHVITFCLFTLIAFGTVLTVPWTDIDADEDDVEAEATGMDDTAGRPGTAGAH